jgi:hypothetical protein
MTTIPAHPEVDAVSSGGNIEVTSYWPASGPANTALTIEGYALRRSGGGQIRVLLGRVVLNTEVSATAQGDIQAFVAQVTVPRITIAVAESGVDAAPVYVQLLRRDESLVEQLYIGMYQWTDVAYPLHYPTVDTSIPALDYALYSSPTDSPVGSSSTGLQTPPPSDPVYTLALPEYNYLTASPAELMGPSVDTSALGLHIALPSPALSIVPTAYGQYSPMPLSASSSVTSFDYSPSPSHAADYFSAAPPTYTPMYMPMPIPAGTRPSAEFVTFLSPLDAMMNDWTEAEVLTGRRLVHFTVTRGYGEQRTVTCRPLHPADYVSVELVDTISCIAKPGPQGGFVITSVDLLHLAGLLYGGRPLTEEKNRLRRHLERLEPKTIGKNREQALLYARIAGFNEPRPLTIVKDVKVFEWTRLEEAMEAIVAKRVSDAPLYWSEHELTIFSRRFTTGLERRTSLFAPTLLHDSLRCPATISCANVPASWGCIRGLPGFFRLLVYITFVFSCITFVSSCIISDCICIFLICVQYNWSSEARPILMLVQKTLDRGKTRKRHFSTSCACDAHLVLLLLNIPTCSVIY